MTCRHWIRRAATAALTLGAAALLAACGSGSVISDLEPERFIVVGDSFLDVGQAGYRHTVNDGSSPWLNVLAANRYGLTVTPASQGGWAYAQGLARVDSPAADGAPSVKEQVDTLLANTSLQTKGDLVFINGGMHDIVAAVESTGLGPDTERAIEAAAQALVTQVQRLHAAGARHIVLLGVYNLDNTPWAEAWGRTPATSESGPMRDLVTLFNSAVKIELVAQGLNNGKEVVMSDAEFFFRSIYDKPNQYPLDNAIDPVCTTPDASTCTPATVVTPNYNRYLFADALHFTPRMLELFTNDDYVGSIYNTIRNSW